MEIGSNFIKTIMAKDLESGKHSEIITRFPPEPNGYFHIGHIRAIATNFELAKAFGGKTFLRFDDTNPVKEEQEFVEAIKKDVAWLGYEPFEIRFASDYFDEMYKRALILIKKGKAFVCDMTATEMAKARGNLTEAGVQSPYRNRSVEENLDLFEKMKAGKFKDGEKVLRAKIDMASPNMNMRDPVIYRIAHVPHHNTGDKWCIYPMYDFAHPLEDAIEGITHSCCSLEFEDHRPLYDWYVRECEMPHIPRQIEFGRLSLTNTVLSKRFLRQMVEENLVDGWDDPRMPTIVGLKRRGFTPEALKKFVLETGLSKVNSSADYRMLEHFIRDDLKATTDRVMAVIEPLKVTITNMDDNFSEILQAENNPDNEALGTREIPFSKHLYIESTDFEEAKPNKKWKRLYLGGEVRLMHAYFITCNEVVKNDKGEIIELLCTYDKATKSGSGFNERKPNGTIHWVDATNNVETEFRLYDYLLFDSEEYEDKSLEERINPNSVTVSQGFVEQALNQKKLYDRFQFVRNGFFIIDKKDDNKIVANRIVELKSSFKQNNK